MPVAARDAESLSPIQHTRTEAIEQGAHIVEDAYRAAGLQWPPDSPTLSYDELKAQAYAERYENSAG